MKIKKWREYYQLLAKYDKTNNNNTCVELILTS